MFVMASFGMLYQSREEAGPAQAEQASPKVEKAPEPDMAQILGSQLQPKLNEIIAAYPNLEISVSCVDVKSGALIHSGAVEAFDAASTGKLLSAILYLHLVETGQAGLQDNVGGLSAAVQLQMLIEKSDNAAWRVLNDRLGHPRLKEYSNSIGLASYNPANNTIVTNDIAKLLEQLYKRKLLNEEHTKLLFDFMSRADQNEYIAPALPPGTQVYHKAGWLKDRFHDAAVIDNGQRPYVLVIFSKSKGQYNPEQGKQLFRSLTETTIPLFFNNPMLIHSDR